MEVLLLIIRLRIKILQVSRGQANNENVAAERSKIFIRTMLRKLNRRATSTPPWTMTLLILVRDSDKR